MTRHFLCGLLTLLACASLGWGQSPSDETLCVPKFAHSVVSFSDPSGGQTLADAQLVLGPTDEIVFSLVNGGNVVVDFTGNLVNSGDSQTDIFVDEETHPETYRVSLLPADAFTLSAVQAAGWTLAGNTTTFWEPSGGLSTFTGNAHFDIDQAAPGYAKGELSFSQVMVTDIASASGSPDISVIEAKFVPTTGVAGIVCQNGFASALTSFAVGTNAMTGASANPQNVVGNNGHIFSLGGGGQVSLCYAFPFSTTGDGGTDLWVDEVSGDDAFRLYVQPANDFTLNAVQAAGWVELADNFWFVNDPNLTFRNGDYDFDKYIPGYAEGELRFSALRIVDDNATHPGDANGAEIRWAKAMAVCRPALPVNVVCAPGYAMKVLEFTEGANPSPNGPNPGQTSNMLGFRGHDYLALGENGEVTFEFIAPFSTTGNSHGDYWVKEIGGHDAYQVYVRPANAFTLDAVQKANWVELADNFWAPAGTATRHVGSGDRNLDHDIPGYLEGELLFDAMRIVSEDEADGAEIAWVKVESVCRTTRAAFCNMGTVTEVESYTAGVNPLISLPNYDTNPDLVLGDDTHNGVSLGEGGSIVVLFESVFSTTGNSHGDIWIDEGGNNDNIFLSFRPSDDLTLCALQAAGWVEVVSGFWAPNANGIHGLIDINLDHYIPGHIEGELHFDALRIVDDNNNPNHPDGAEINRVKVTAVCTLFDTFACAPRFASELIAVNLGSNADQITSPFNDPDDVLGNDLTMGLNLGANGRVTLGFGDDFSTSGDSAPDLCVSVNNFLNGYGVCLRPANSFTLEAIQHAGWPHTENGFYRPSNGANQFVGNGFFDIDAVLPGYAEGVIRFDGVMVVDDNTTHPTGTATGVNLLAVEAKFVCSNGTPIGGTIFEDVDGNGQPDAGEPGIAGVTVTLLDDQGNPVSTTTTDNNGAYEFIALPGDYTVQVGAPGNLQFANPGPGSDVDENGTSDPITVALGDAPVSINAGLVELGTVTSQLFEDLNGDGVNNANEPGLADVVVELLDDQGLPTGISDMTDGNGNFQLPATPGTYSLQVTLPNGFQFTTPNAPGVDEGLDSDVDPLTGISAPFDLASGETTNDVSAGILALANLGTSFVFEDLNGNGQQDPGEPGLAGVVVDLLDENGMPTGDTVTTGPDGAYNFPVEPGTYSLEFTLPNGFEFTAPNVGPEGTDSDVDPNTGTTPPVTVGSGDTVDDLGAGATAPAKFDGVVFEDLNGDGQQNPGEPGIAGAIVNVLDNAGQPTGVTATTDMNGDYEVNVDPGDYILEFVLPNGVNFTLADIGNDALDSDADPTTGQTPVISIGSGDVNQDVAAGGIAEAKIGGNVFEDLNGSGQQDVGEPGVGGVTVILLDDNGQPTGQSTLSEGDGSYEFLVTPGVYAVNFQLPTGLEFTSPNLGNDNLDSDADPLTGNTPQYTIQSGETALDVAAGVIAIAKIGGDTVFEDVNGNGQQDAGEPGLSGITITLLDGQGAPTGQSAVTDTNGNYLFCVTPGDYILAFTPPTGLEFTTPNSGPDATDSDVDPISGQTPVIPIASGDDIQDVGAGLIALAKIGDRVFEDLNGNGQADAGEPGIANIPVSLLDDQGAPTGQSTATDGAGAYQFCVEPGDYIVAFGLPTGFNFTTPNAGNDATDSDVDPMTGRTGVITVSSGDTELDVAAGLLALAKIGGSAFEDVNGNGQQDGSEPGIGGVTVVLLDDNGQTVDSTSTGTDGSYEFSVDPGTYSVLFSAPNGFVFTDANVGSDASDSDANPADGTTAPIVANSGTNNLDVSAGLLTPADFAGTVFEDINGNGQQDAGEPGLANVTVSVIDATTGTTVATAQTGSNGDYVVDVEPGTYVVNFNAPNGFNFTDPNVGDDATDSDADVNGDTAPVTVVSGDDIANTSAGLTQPTVINSFVWEDLDADGEQDANEPGLPGVAVFLLDEMDMPTGLQAVSDANGFFTITADPGTYSLAFLLPNGFRFTVPNNSTDDLDSDVNPSNGATPTMVFGSGATTGTVDAGLVALPDANDYVYPNRVNEYDNNGFPIPDDPNQALGTPDGQAVGLGSGGCIAVSVACFQVTTTGDANPDIAVFEAGDIDDYMIELLPANVATELALQTAGFADANGNGYYEAGTFFGTFEFDLDALIPGFATGELLFAQVKISDIMGGANLIADVDAVGFAATVPVGVSVDDSGLVDADYVRFTRDFNLGGGVTDPNQNVFAIEGPMDGNALSLGEGGSLCTGLLGAWFANSGDAEADVIVFEEGEDEAYFIDLCPANAFTTQALIDAGYADPDGDGCYRVFSDQCPGDLALDIDALLPGFDMGELIFEEVKIIDDNFGPDTTPNAGADIDAVALPTRVLPGNVPTDDFVFEIGMNGAPKVSEPADMMVVSGDVLELQVSSPSGVYDGIPYLIGIMCVSTGTPITPPVSLPGVWLNPDRAPVNFLGDGPVAMPLGTCFPIVVPAGVADICCTFQAFGLTPNSPNGVFVASNGFEICAD